MSRHGKKKSSSPNLDRFLRLAKRSDAASMDALRGLVSSNPDGPLDKLWAVCPVSALLCDAKVTPEAFQAVVDAGASPVRAYRHLTGSRCSARGINLLLAWERLTPGSECKLTEYADRPYWCDEGVVLDTVEKVVRSRRDGPARWRLAAILEYEREHGAIEADSIADYMRSFDLIPTPTEFQHNLQRARTGVWKTYEAVLGGTRRMRQMASGCFGGGDSRPDSSRYFPVAAHDGAMVSSSPPEHNGAPSNNHLKHE